MTLLKKVFRTQMVGHACPCMLTLHGTFPQFGLFLASKWNVGPAGLIILEFFQRSHPYVCPLSVPVKLPCYHNLLLDRIVFY